ncbi:unnamed protein product [Calicophoron daubneyi]|uniref:Uncharacterized protein n=1 Tax=Calicophoron daubneyi TaxID=300641 RepID=A0AAV2TZD3_CALDB
MLRSVAETMIARLPVLPLDDRMSNEPRKGQSTAWFLKRNTVHCDGSDSLYCIPLLNNELPEEISPVESYNQENKGWKRYNNLIPQPTRLHGEVKQNGWFGFMSHVASRFSVQEPTFHNRITKRITNTSDPSSNRSKVHNQFTHLRLQDEIQEHGDSSDSHSESRTCELGDKSTDITYVTLSDKNLSKRYGSCSPPKQQQRKQRQQLQQQSTPYHTEEDMMSPLKAIQFPILRPPPRRRVSGQKKAGTRRPISMLWTPEFERDWPERTMRTPFIPARSTCTLTDPAGLEKVLEYFDGLKVPSAELDLQETSGQKSQAREANTLSTNTKESVTPQFDPVKNKSNDRSGPSKVSKENKWTSRLPHIKELSENVVYTQKYKFPFTTLQRLGCDPQVSGATLNNAKYSRLYRRNPTSEEHKVNNPKKLHQWAFTFYDIDGSRSAEDTDAILHSVFAVVSARMRQNFIGYVHPRSRSTDFSRPASLQRPCNRNVEISSNISPSSNEMKQLLRLCIQWMPSKLEPDKHSVNKTHIFATLGVDPSTGQKIAGFPCEKTKDCAKRHHQAQKKHSKAKHSKNCRSERNIDWKEHAGIKQGETCYFCHTKIPGCNNEKVSAATTLTTFSDESIACHSSTSSFRLDLDSSSTSSPFIHKLRHRHASARPFRCPYVENQRYSRACACCQYPSVRIKPEYVICCCHCVHHLCCCCPDYLNRQRRTRTRRICSTRLSRRTGQPRKRALDDPESWRSFSNDQKTRRRAEKVVGRTLSQPQTKREQHQLSQPSGSNSIIGRSDGRQNLPQNMKVRSRSHETTTMYSVQQRNDFSQWISPPQLSTDKGARENRTRDFSERISSRAHDRKVQHRHRKTLGQQQVKEWLSHSSQFDEVDMESPVRAVNPVANISE